MPARLIINADDFGLTAGVNRAVIELYKAGALSSATLMAGGPAFEHAAALARAHPGLGVGCHLVFVGGRPISPPAEIRSLLGPDGRSFPSSLPAFLFALHTGRIVAEDLARETRAQITRLQRAGVSITHVDTHKHTHLFAAVAGAVFQAAAECGVRNVRNPIEPAWSLELTRKHASLLRATQMSILRRLRSGSSGIPTAAPNLLTTDGTLGILATGKLETALETLVETTLNFPDQLFELCIHPGHYDDDLQRASTRLLQSREREYGALLQLAGKLPGLRTKLQLVTYRELDLRSVANAPA